MSLEDKILRRLKEVEANLNAETKATEMDADITKDGSSKMPPKKGTGTFIEKQTKAFIDEIYGRKNKKQGFKGMYCTKCNSVWEMIRRPGEAEDVQVNHPDFPSYGLERQDCSECCNRKI